MRTTQGAGALTSALFVSLRTRYCSIHCSRVRLWSVGTRTVRSSQSVASPPQKLKYPSPLVSTACAPPRSSSRLIALSEMRMPVIIAPSERKRPTLGFWIADYACHRGIVGSIMLILLRIWSVQNAADTWSDSTGATFSESPTRLCSAAGSAAIVSAASTSGRFRFTASFSAATRDAYTAVPTRFIGVRNATQSTDPQGIPLVCFSNCWERR
jgi:hypothetical protein